MLAHVWVPQARRIRGGALQILLFVIAVVGITATASIAIYKAYDEYIQKPRAPSEIKRLNDLVAQLEDENRNLKADKTQLSAQLTSSSSWKESEAFRQYLINLTIKYAQALEDQRARDERVIEHRASPSDLISKIADTPAAPTIESKNREYYTELVRAQKLAHAIKVIESQADKASVSVFGFTDAELKLLKTQLPATKAALTEIETGLESKATEVIVEEAAKRASRRK